ncbi:Peptidase S54, rhomboid domain protein [Cellulophaga lytica DSM 7489]|uniref:Peptidase S54, rhomboid domain protein n=1 Tax=Cellulophaga lytica (strain ATCC 23178 / DSM 7489 / JCM 8516 / NBRC 14961 / NCIMB 1423 / VKM B-1433 / Cy l20) TaxID=867900 RepID=F0RH52_CELLC|nr:rhomboid family intramembrane serine protease [Cellulophaga lytica]ADY28090.1 Peptidase S54, rhomboid domain protein [Cellulophaga lytica DSM 7489]WQG77723.1 rhomboid family intramembrane serine protease [Cellulophaga lytica]
MNGDLKYQYARLNIAEKLIAINVVIFLLNLILVNLFRLPNIVNWFNLPENIGDFILQPWSIVTYSFFHSGFGHIFWNMLMLYFFGRTFLNLFDAKKFLNVYFLGVIVGGFLFMIGYNTIPALLNQNGVLIGASAGVTAILIYVCTYLPNQTVRLLIIDLKLWHLGVIIVVLDLLRLSNGQNVGGMLSHLGGAALGYFYAKQLMNGKDIGAGFGRFMDSIANLFRRDKKAPMKTVYKSAKPKSKTTGSTTANVDRKKADKQRKIDAILDKISKSGYESLSKEEKDFLFIAGKED